MYKSWVRSVARTIIGITLVGILLSAAAQGLAGASSTNAAPGSVFEPLNQIIGITLPSTGPATLTFGDGRTLHVAHSVAKQITMQESKAANTPASSTSGLQPLNESGGGCATFFLWMWPDSNTSGAVIYTGWKANTAELGALTSAAWFVHGFNNTYTRPFGFFMYGATLPPISWSGTAQAVEGAGFYTGSVIPGTSYIEGQNGFCLPVNIDTYTTVN